MTTTTHTPAASINDSTCTADRDALTRFAKDRDGLHTLSPWDIAVAAGRVLTCVAFRDIDTEPVQQVVRVLERINALELESPALLDHGVRSFVGAVAIAAVGGYSLSVLTERVTDTLDAHDRDRPVRRLESGATVIGSVTVPAHTVTRDHGTAWPETLEIPAQTADLILSAQGDRIGASFTGMSVRRESGAQWGGVDVARSVDTTPRSSTDHLGTHTFAGAKVIATTGALFGGDVVLARGVTITCARYTHAGADPRAMAWAIVLPA